MKQFFPHAIYDLRLNPITFDFCAFLAAASLVARANNFEGIDLTLIATGYRNITPREKAYSLKERLWRLNNLIIPLIQLCSWVKNFHVITQRAECHEMGDLKIPNNYQFDAPLSVGYSPKAVISLHKNTKLSPVLFAPSEHALDVVSNAFSGRKLVTLTPRIASFDLTRNSELTRWYELCVLLRDSGYRVVILPDQDDVLGAKHYLKFDWEVYEPASLSMDLRLAMMKIAKQNIISSGGLAGLANYSDSPYVLCNILNPSSAVANEKYFREFVGIGVGEKYPWCAENQHFYWHEFDPTQLLKYCH